MAEILIQRRRHRNVWPWLLGLLALALLPLPFLAADRDDGRAPRRAATRRVATTRADTTAALTDTTAVPGARTAPGTVPRGSRGSGVVAARPAGQGPGSERTTQSVAGAIAASPSATPPAGSPAASSTSSAPPAPSAGAAARPTAAPAGSAAPGANFERFIATGSPRTNESEHRQYASEALRRLATELRALGASSTGVRAIIANADSLRMTGTRGNADPDHARAAFLAAVRELDVLRTRYRAPVDTGALRAAAWAVRPDQRLLAQRNTLQTFFERASDALRSLSRSRNARRGADRPTR